jgi:hypothetical protein
MFEWYLEDGLIQRFLRVPQGEGQGKRGGIASFRPHHFAASLARHKPEMGHSPPFDSIQPDQAGVICCVLFVWRTLDPIR